MRYVDRGTVQTIEDMDDYIEHEYSFSDAIQAQPDPPCDDRGDNRPCEHKAMCGLNNLACKAFFAYTREPTGSLSFIGWRRMERKPSIDMFTKVHTDHK